MTNIICDICKKSIPAAVRSYSWETRYDRYDTLKDKDICPDCMEALEGEVERELMGSDVYRFNDVRAIIERKLDELTVWKEKDRNKVIQG